MDKAFVTGGSGFVGRSLIRALSSRGTRVVALARSDAAESAVRREGAEPVRGDLDNIEALRAGMNGCDAVFHAAAFVEMWGTRDEFFRVNVAGTENVLSAARAAGVPVVVHVSTEAILAGEEPIIQADEARPPAQHPAGLYGLTKAIAEERVAGASSKELRTVIIRPRFIWGKGDTSVLPKIAEAVRKGEYMWIDHGRYLTSTCHIDNVVEGALLAAARGRSGEAYFLTDGPPVLLRDFMGAMLRAVGLEPGTRSIPRWVARGLAAAVEAVWAPLGLTAAPPITKMMVCLLGDEVTVKDDKARRELGYRGMKSREEGLQEMREASGDEGDGDGGGGGGEDHEAEDPVDDRDEDRENARKA
jgi:nucleoside-diphosphate-sugar epimerase